jgi:protoporphyrinogen oxidase
MGFSEPRWKWSLEEYYHHFFINDTSAIDLAKEIGQVVTIKRPKASTFINGQTYQLDSPMSLLGFNKINFSDRIRTGAVLAFLKTTKNWKALEKVTAKEFLIKWNGRKVWDILWKPLFEKKFSNYSNQIPASWFWARIKKRTTKLAYPKGGFLSFAENLEDFIKRYNGKFLYNSPVETIYRKGGIFEVLSKGKVYQFDKVICTLPTHHFLKITKDLPEKYIDNLSKLRGIGAINVILSLNNKFLEDDTYWLNINSTHFPFVAVVEHTNFIDKRYYNNEHLLYVGNYLSPDHKYFKMDAGQILKDFYPFLKTINPKFNESWINSAYLFKNPFAQPIVLKNYSKYIPDYKTPIKDLYLCNMQQVYPWDRGTNYAIENGKKVAEMIMGE